MHALRARPAGACLARSGAPPIPASLTLLKGTNTAAAATLPTIGAAAAVGATAGGGGAAAAGGVAASAFALRRRPSSQPSASQAGSATRAPRRSAGTAAGHRGRASCGRRRHRGRSRARGRSPRPARTRSPSGEGGEPSSRTAPGVTLGCGAWPDQEGGRRRQRRRGRSPFRQPRRSLSPSPRNRRRRRRSRRKPRPRRAAARNPPGQTRVQPEQAENAKPPPAGDAPGKPAKDE